MAYKLSVTYRVTAVSHDREEVVVADLAEIGRAIAEGAPPVWDVCFAVITGKNAEPGKREPAATLTEAA